MEPRAMREMGRADVPTDIPPPLTQERKQELIALAGRMAEMGKDLNPREWNYCHQALDLLTNPHRC